MAQDTLQLRSLPIANRFFGLEISQPMLNAAEKHAKITYIHGAGDELGSVIVQKLDVVTFAGSLFYTKSDKLRDELAKICVPGGYRFSV